MVPTQLAVWHGSKLTPIMPRAWKSTWLCNWLHPHLPIEHRHFSHEEKSRKCDLDDNWRLQWFRRNLLCGTDQNSLQSCREHGNRPGFAIGCTRTSRSSTGIFRMKKNQENAIWMTTGVCNGSDATCCVARIKTHSNHAASMEIDLALQLAAPAPPDRAQEFFG